MTQFDWLPIVNFINYFSLFYMLAFSLINAVQLISSFFFMVNQEHDNLSSDYDRYVDSDNMVPVSVIVPMFNEEMTAVDTIYNMLSLDFPEFEVVVVNDGSHDKTLSLIVDEFKMVVVNYPYRDNLKHRQIRAIYRSTINEKVVLVDKENGGKGDAVNAGIVVSFYPVFVVVDGDSLLERDSLLRISYTFMRDTECIAVGGAIRIASDCRIVDGILEKTGLSNKAIVNLQILEYLRAFLTGRAGFDTHQMLLIISGAFGAFRRTAVINAGGYATDSNAEDMEMVIRLHRYNKENKQKYNIRILLDPVCWTMPPDNLKDLLKQRRRWHAGLMDTLFRHKKMLFNPRYGRIGMVALPYYWIFEFLGPTFELIGYLFVVLTAFLGFISAIYAIKFYIICLLFGIILSLGALLCEEKAFRKYPKLSQTATLMFYAVIDNFGYRQILTIIRSVTTFKFNKHRKKWESMKRSAFFEKTE